MSNNIKNDNEILIKFVNLTKKFGDFTAVSNVNLEIKRGEIVGFLGPNGAGKSTTMKLMAQLLKPTEGEVWIRENGNGFGHGQLIKLTNQNKDILLDNIGFLIENPAFYGSLSPRTILKYFGKLKGFPRKKLDQRIEKVLRMMGMEEWIDKKIKTFSKGMRQKIGIASAIVHDPDIVVLDEPQTGLDPKARKDVRNFILELKKMGKTIFLSSHLLYEISEVADRIAIINRGKIIAFDTLDNLEAKSEKSIIQFEMLKAPEGDIQSCIEDLKKIIYPLTGIGNDARWIRYNPDSRVFQLLFDGKPSNQFKILQALINKGYEVTEFSVPKAGLLEDLFIELTQPDRINMEG